MSNQEIIDNEYNRLLSEGLITKKEEIHTKNQWSTLGFKLKPGVEPISKLNLWFKGKIIYKKLSFFYSSNQVERI